MALQMRLIDISIGGIKRKVEPSFYTYLPCRAWTPRNMDKENENPTWMYFV